MSVSTANAEFLLNHDMAQEAPELDHVHLDDTHIFFHQLRLGDPSSRQCRTGTLLTLGRRQDLGGRPTSAELVDTTVCTASVNVNPSQRLYGHSIPRGYPFAQCLS